MGYTTSCDRYDPGEDPDGDGIYQPEAQAQGQAEAGVKAYGLGKEAGFEGGAQAATVYASTEAGGVDVLQSMTSSSEFPMDSAGRLGSSASAASSRMSYDGSRDSTASIVNGRWQRGAKLATQNYCLARSTRAVNAEPDAGARRPGSGSSTAGSDPGRRSGSRVSVV